MIVNTLKLSEPDFPKLIADIPTPPKQLYWTGANPYTWLEKPRVAVVGSRKLSGYGKTITERLVAELARAGVVIISGLAFGVDVTAHKAALAAGGTTVAVLPSGLDQIYPAAHANIGRQIAEQGTLISEYPAGSIAYKVNFIARNRIVSGLADVLLITEAAVNSGSLHTARFAMEQGKTVMAVPGNINSLTSEGTNNLIKSGALPVTEVGDILFALKLTPAKIAAAAKFLGTEQEAAVYGLIKQGVSAQDELAQAAKIGGPELSSALTMLEISGYIRPLGSGNWAAK